MRLPCRLPTTALLTCEIHAVSPWKSPLLTGQWALRRVPEIEERLAVVETFVAHPRAAKDYQHVLVKQPDLEALLSKTVTMLTRFERQTPPKPSLQRRKCPQGKTVQCGKSAKAHFGVQCCKVQQRVK